MPKFKLVPVKRERIVRPCVPFIDSYMEIHGILHLSDGNLHEGKIVYENMMVHYIDEVGTERHNVTWFERDPECIILYEDRKERPALSEGDCPSE
jgi:hypothetical protein